MKNVNSISDIRRMGDFNEKGWNTVKAKNF